MATKICYELTVSGDVADSNAVRLLDDLRKRALSIGAPYITPLWRLSGKELLLESWHEWPPPHSGYLTARPFDREKDESLPVDIAGFMMRSTFGSELAVFALFRSRSVDGKDRDWIWEYCSDSKGRSGQRPLMQLLRAAREVGFQVRISINTDVVLRSVHSRETIQEVNSVRVNENSMLTWLPAESLEAIGIKPEQMRELVRPDQSLITRWTAPAIIRVEDQETIEDVIVCEDGDEPQLGWHALSGLNLRVDESTGALVDRGPIPAAAARVAARNSDETLIGMTNGHQRRPFVGAATTSSTSTSVPAAAA